MLFRQLFDTVYCTYTYIIASRQGGEALIIDPVIDRVDLYLRLLKELDLKLVKALDTHVHADHITGLGALRDATKCITVMGEQASVDVVSVRVGDGDEIPIEGLSLRAIYTPGHTDDSYCYQLADRVFTGDTLLIRGTGRTDFQHGDSYAQYDSIFSKLLTLPDDTLVFPGHDYKGETVSTIAEERAFNPRLQVDSPAAYAEIMANLNLANPKMMDVAVPANQAVGLHQEELESRGLSIECAEARDQIGATDSVLIDLRDAGERTREGIIPGSVHAPYGALDDNVASGGLLNVLAQTTGKRLIFYCAFGERSAMAVETALAAGLANCCHIKGGIDAWKKTDSPLSH